MFFYWLEIVSDLVIHRSKMVAGQTRLVVTLIDPVRRAYSHNQMTIVPEGTPAQPRSRGERVDGVWCRWWLAAQLNI